MLEEHTQEKVFLAPPQAYELARLYNLKSFNSFQEMIQKRERYGCERWFPVITTYADGAISTLPGDELYPKDVDLFGKLPMPDYPLSINEMREKSIKINRIELRGIVCLSLCNQQLNCGHLSPVSYPPITTGIQSML